MNTLNLMTLEHDKAAVAGSSIEALAASLQGSLLMNGDAGYDEARTIWNAMIDRSPG